MKQKIVLILLSIMFAMAPVSVSASPLKQNYDVFELYADIFEWAATGFEEIARERQHPLLRIESLEGARLYKVDHDTEGLVPFSSRYFIYDYDIEPGQVFEALDIKLLQNRMGDEVLIAVLPPENNLFAKAVLLEIRLFGGQRVLYFKKTDSELSSEPQLVIRDAKPIGNANLHKVARFVHDPEDLSRINDQIQNHFVYNELKKLQQAVHNHKYSYRGLRDHLKQSSWYETLLNYHGSEVAEDIVKLVDWVKITGQPIQCVILDRIVKAAYPQMPLPEIRSGAKGYAKEMARYIYPTPMPYRETPLPYGAVQLSQSYMPVEYYQPGDLFVTIEGTFGHTGIVLGKYLDEHNQVVLLVADSNRGMDGQLRFYAVDKYNINLLMGDEYMFVIRDESVLNAVPFTYNSSTQSFPFP